MPIQNLLFAGVVLLTALLTSASASELDSLLRTERHPACGVEREEPITWSTCSWDAADRQTGRCDAPEHQVVVGKRYLFKECRTLFDLEYGYRQRSPTRLQRLLEKLQPLVTAAMAVPPPECQRSGRGLTELHTKEDHLAFFACQSAIEEARLERVRTDERAALVKSIETTLRAAKFDDPDSATAVDELMLLLEDAGDKPDLQEVQFYLQRIH